MTGRRRSIAAEIFQAFLDGAAKALNDKEDARKQAEAEEERVREAQKPRIRPSPLSLGLRGGKSLEGDGSGFNPPSLTDIFNATAQAREEEEAKARQKELDDTHLGLMISDPEYRAATWRRQQEAQAAQQRLFAKQKADLRKMRELSEYGRSRPERTRTECYTCDGRGSYFSNRLRRTVDCIDCSGKGWRRSRY